MLKKLINSFSLIFETANKERKLIFKDDATVEIYIFFVALVYFFYSFVYSPEIFTKLPVAYVDNDQTTISHKIKRMLNDTESMSIAYDASSMEEAKHLFENGKVNGIVVIPEKFSEKLQKSGGNPSIAIYCDASYMLYYDKTLQAVTNALGAFTGEIQLKQTMMSGVPMKEAVASSKPFNIIANPLYNLEEGYGIFIIPMVLIVALQTLQLTGMGVLYGTMREQNTFSTHFAMAKRSRFGYFFMTLGRAIPYLFISMLLLLLGILVVFHIFTIPQRGNLGEVIVFLIPVVLAITFLGMSLMSIFRNREDTIMLLTVFSIPALMMGGVSYPIVAFPLWIKITAFFFPSTIGVKGFLALTQAGASLPEISDIYIQMWLICLFYFILALWTNRRFLYKQFPLASELQSTENNIDNNTTITSNLINTAEEQNNLVSANTLQSNTNSETDIKKLLEPLKDSTIDFDKITNAIIPSVTKKLKTVNLKNLQTPPSYIAVRTFESMRNLLNNTIYKNMYCNLLANLMDKETANQIHTSYIESINKISSDESKLLVDFINEDLIPAIKVNEIDSNNLIQHKLITYNHIDEYNNLKLDYPENLDLYYENLINIGLLASVDSYGIEDNLYVVLENCELVKTQKNATMNRENSIQIERKHLRTTEFGKKFIKIVIKDKD